MQIRWRTLIGYGFVFWCVLCTSEFLGFTNISRYKKGILKPYSPEISYDKPTFIQNIENQLHPHLKKYNYKGLEFGWSLLIWNTLTFVASVLTCSAGRSLFSKAWSFYVCYKNKNTCGRLISSNQYLHSDVPSTTASKIPVIIKPSFRFSEPAISKHTGRSSTENKKSCPDLMKRSCSSLSSATNISAKTCRAVYMKELFLSHNPRLSDEEQLEKECKKLKEELHRLQTTSLREHASLARNLDRVSKENQDLNDKLSFIQRENRGARQQVEELLQEKSYLLKKMENAAKEYKSITRSKKYALAKLEEVSNESEELRQHFLQVSRDKDIIEKKLKLLETEYSKLHEKYISSQPKYMGDNDYVPERDHNDMKTTTGFYPERYTTYVKEDNCESATIQQTAQVLASVSQTEFDMKLIQEKIKELEKNLENLNMSNGDFLYAESADQEESDLSLSEYENDEDSQTQIYEGSNSSLTVYAESDSPMYKYLPEKFVDLIGQNKQIMKFQTLAVKMREKAKYLTTTDTQSTITLSDSDFCGDRTRMVSNSQAFKNFLKGLNNLDKAKQPHLFSSEVYY